MYVITIRLSIASCSVFYVLFRWFVFIIHPFYIVQVHHYHVLECREITPGQSVGEVILPDPDAPELLPPFKPDNAPMEQPPVYQEITELSRDHK